MSAAPRSDLNQPGEFAINRFPEPHRSIARAADAAIRSAVPGSAAVVKWGNPCYFLDGECIAVLYKTKASVNLGLAGATLKDPQRLLEGTGRSMRHVKLKSPELASSPAVADLIRGSAAIGLHRM
jgi:hypothetical protein